jgi:lysophospholipase L1-like esterase
VAAVQEPAQADQLSAEGNPLPRLAHFYDALSGLAARSRGQNVRVVWLGDSHTQADGWTHALRVSLQERFGKGGPGFVHLGWTEKKYRHRAATVRVHGSFRIEPSTLVSARKYDDGILGLGGVRMKPVEGSPRAVVSVDAGQLPGKGRWDVAFRMRDAGDALSLSMAGGRSVTVTGRDADAGRPEAIRHVELESAGPGGSLEVAVAAGAPELMGVVVESAEPGVVVDTLGLNGARYLSALAYDETSWVSELSRRSPDLVIMAYGSNESSDPKIDPARHGALVDKLVARVRAAAPGADCLVFGPIDRGGRRYEQAVEVLNEGQREAARRLGCAFWSGQTAMGGKGSMLRWEAESPALAQADLLHLTMKGYERLGQSLARDVLQAFDSGRR